MCGDLHHWSVAMHSVRIKYAACHATFLLDIFMLSDCQRYGLKRPKYINVDEHAHPKTRRFLCVMKTKPLAASFDTRRYVAQSTRDAGELKLTSHYRRR